MAKEMAPNIPLAAIATYPLPGMAIPGELAFSPDDALITYLWSPDRTLTRQLYAFDTRTNEHSLLLAPLNGGTTEDSVTLAEALRRERQRQLMIGVTSYAWAQEANRMLTTLNGDVYVQDGVDAPLRKLVAGDRSPVLDAQFSPNGEWVAYVQDAELYVVPANGGAPRQLTTGARGTGKTHGLAEYVAQEEMDRSHGFWWSPDNNHIAFTEVDETHIPVYRIMHQGKGEVGAEAQEDHHYPFAGMANAYVRLGVIATTGGEPVWMDLGSKDDIYLARVQWLPGNRLTAQIENRAQTELDLVQFECTNGEATALLHETSDVWINLHDMLKPLKDTGHGLDHGFIWASERTGFQHLYLYDGQGQLVRQLTSGDWIVDSIVGIDEQQQQVYFMSTLAEPTERQLYAVSFAGSEPRRITEQPGLHTAVVEHAHNRFIDIYDALDHPPTVRLRSLHDGGIVATIYDQPDPSVADLSLRPPELVMLENRTGVQLHGALYRPTTDGAGPYPTIISVYGGPQAQRVTRGWSMTVDMRAQYLASLGFLVFVLDNRGSARRGLAFEGAIKHDMGHLEVEDQVDGVRWLAGQGLADATRVGIYGWSYGGYMALMCLVRAPETFKVAVAGAPVTHMDGYDTHYTERYMGTPQENPDSYVASSVMQYVDQLRGKLLLVHGLIDENVHFRHTARLINALVRARKPYDLLLFPDERHMPRKLADRVFMEERVRDYFLHHLKKRHGRRNTRQLL